MINIEDRHLAIVKSILAKYDYSFYLFGSRATKKVKKLSDLDLVYFEDIPFKTLIKLEEEFEESDLPYKVDLVSYNKCNADFQRLMLQNYVCLQASSKLEMVERNHLDHFAFLPKKLGFELIEIHDIKVINCGLQTSMFNIANGAPKTLKACDAIHEIKQEFAGQPFAWWVKPSQHNQEFTKALLENDFIIETIEYAMICDLSTSLEQKTDLHIKHVADKASLEDFISVLEFYDKSARNFYELLNAEQLSNKQTKEKLFVGYERGKPVTIGILFVGEDSAGIFSLITKEEVRGKGYGTGMMIFLMEIARENSCKFVTLSASSDSGYRIYERLGFYKIGEFECFEYRGISKASINEFREVK